MEILAQHGALIVLTGASQEPRTGMLPRPEGTAKPHKAPGPLLAKAPTASGTGNTKGSPGTRGTTGPPGTQAKISRASWDTGKPQSILGHREPQGLLGHRQSSGHPRAQGQLKGVMDSSRGLNEVHQDRRIFFPTDTCLMAIFGNSKLKFHIVNAQF